MATARPRTVLTPKPEPKAKPEAPDPRGPWKGPRPGERYRCRPTAENPWGGFDRPFYSDDLDAVQERAAANRANGTRCYVEEAFRYGYYPMPGERDE